MKVINHDGDEVRFQVYEFDPFTQPSQSLSPVRSRAAFRRDAGLARDHLPPIECPYGLTRVDASTAATPDEGEVAGSIPASPTLPTGARAALNRTLVRCGAPDLDRG